MVSLPARDIGMQHSCGGKAQNQCWVEWTRGVLEVRGEQGSGVGGLVIVSGASVFLNSGS